MRRHCAHWVYQCFRCGAQFSGLEPAVVLFMKQHEAYCNDASHHA